MPQKKKWNYEKIGIYLSAAALAISIASPFVTYYYLDPQLQAFQNRARLQVSIVEELPTEKSADDESQRSQWQKEVEAIFAKPWKVQIENVGNLPAKDVQITLDYSPFLSSALDDVQIEFDPPADASRVIKYSKVYLVLKRPIAPQDKITMTVYEKPDEVWIYTEFGEANSIKNPIDLEKFLEATKDIWTKPVNTPPPPKSRSN